MGVKRGPLGRIFVGMIGREHRCINARFGVANR
jgi:hypothetical protein